MKKRVFSLVLALLVCAVLIPAPEAHAAPNTINVYNWGQYISDGTDGYIDINAAFEEATGIHVNYMTFDSNETSSRPAVLPTMSSSRPTIWSVG